MRGSRVLLPPENRDPLRVLFVIGSMPVGGAERLLSELIRAIDRKRFWPELCCLREPAALGERLASEVPVFSDFTEHSYDVFLLGPLARLMRDRRIDAVVTIGTGGDNMFWGRLAAMMADVPVVCTALHAAATDTSARVEWVNRLLAPLTDAFIAVTRTHARQLIDREHFPASKVHAIRNGVNLETFRRSQPDDRLKAGLGLRPDWATVGVVAGLRPEKNLGMFLATAARVLEYERQVQFVLVGDGPSRAMLKDQTLERRIADQVHFLGERDDVAKVLSLFDLFLLTSDQENCPPAVLEAMACELPVIATHVGSLDEMVTDGETGYLVAPGDVETAAARVLSLLSNPRQRALFGVRARQRVISDWSLGLMVRRYEDLLLDLYRGKCAQPERPKDLELGEVAQIL